MDLVVRTGEVFGFLGPNGAGKTTTLRMLVGLVRPSAGTATVLGLPAGDPAGLRRVGALIEGPAFYPYLSGRDNLRVLARRAGASAAAVDAALSQVGLAARGRDRYSRYSLGMKQRLGVAGALLTGPDLLILDEPTNGLDPQGMGDMRELVRSLGQAGHTIVLSSHLMGEVEQVCDRVGIIANGAMVAESTIDDLRGQGHIVVGVDNAARAEAVLAKALGASQVRLVGGAVQIDGRAGDIGAINHALVSHGIGVTEIRRLERTLEEVFLELTSSVPGTNSAAKVAHDAR
ncbi:ATP-binding cassette domain-containing protein [Actinopolymorpha rutila]|uniref:ATP-binding cassette domain-containing protein n=1 Tax=Actinopolymorpha rutila TaxID=446787 RepID=UPI00307DC567